MKTTKFIKESKACQLCAVSANTLSRFSESGYLKRKGSSSGFFYNTEELISLFGVKNDSIHQQIQKEIAEDNTSKPILNKPRTVKSKKKKYQKRTENKIQKELHKKAVDSETLSKKIQKLDAQKKNNEINNKDILRLENLIKLQEKMLDAKDIEIKDLKKQREWLQERVEKLDEKAERDQMLLLAETQMLNKMLNFQQRNKGPVTKALEWLGYKKNTTTIEVD